MSRINKNSRIPLYYQLVDIILNEIEEGGLEENSQLTTERELCEIYEISRATVRQAIGILEKDGYIYKVQGKGTFIAPKKIEQTLEKFYSFGDQIKKMGRKATSKVLSSEIIRCTGYLGKQFNCSEEENLHKLVRIRYSDNEAIIYEESYLPIKRFEKLDSLKIEKDGLYNYLKKKYKVKLDYATEVFSVVVTEEKVSSYLEEKLGKPAMKVERITYENEKVIEYTESIVKGDKFKFKIFLKNI